MKRIFAVLACGLMLAVSTVHAVEASAPIEPAPNIPIERLKPLQLVTEIPRTTWNTLKFSFQRDSVPVWWGLIVSTALLYQYDSDIYESSAAQGRRWNLGNSDKTKTVIEAGPYPLLRLPSDTGSALYFLGDGWTHFGISAGFALYGYTHEDAPRAWNTGLQIFHGMMVSTIFNQTVKRTTGRETPDHRSSDKRGVWRPFPNQIEYSKENPKYDAFPSGHIMTATLMFTSVRLNYPEYSVYIWPVQVVWSAALMFQMMNNGVHWASDYPLGIAMGWATAKMAFQMGKDYHPGRGFEASASHWHFTPLFSLEGDPMPGLVRYF